VTPAALTGLLVLDKPAGITSHGCVAGVRRALGTRKVGHAGTLDPMATGVLLVGVGRATRLLGYLAGHDKDYEATIRLGLSTVTDDREGEVVSTAEPRSVEAITAEAIEGSVAALRGEIEQIPSSVSAIKVDGKRAHALVRAGEDVRLTARRVRIDRFDVLQIRRGDGWIDVDVAVTCTSGTYVRALARDLGDELGVGGHLTSLRRTRVGGWGVTDAIAWTSLTTSEHPAEFLIPTSEIARRAFPTLEVVDSLAVENGRPVSSYLHSDVTEPTALLSQDGRLLALVGPKPPPSTGVGYLAVFVP